MDQSPQHRTDAPDPEKVRQHPRWFTPLRLLAIFCATSLMVYLDRGLIASNGVNGRPRTDELPEGSGIQGAFNLTNFQDGLLATSFLVGLLLASPVFSEACKHYSAFRLMGAGMGVWVLATLGCGLAPSFAALIACRMLVGVGEASFVALAAPFIDDYAPPQHKARWFAAFYLTIPVGFAGGYVFGGVVAAAWGWRAAFAIESLAMVPFVAFAFVSRSLHLGGMHDMGPDPSRPRTLRDVVSELTRDAAAVAAHPVWMAMVAAYVLYVAVLGVYSFWGPKAGSAIYDLEPERADLVFGAVTVLTGIFGSLAGGALLDAVGANLRNANALCAAAVLLGFVLMLTAFLGTRSFAAFMGVFAAGELALFCTQAPVGAIGMWSVPPALRPLAISLTTVAIHVLGDVPSPPLVGWLETQLEAGKPPEEASQQWRVSVSLVTVLLVGSSAMFGVAAWLTTEERDYRKGAAAEGRLVDADEEGAAGGGGGGGSGGAAAAAVGAGDRQPLLEGGSPNSAAGLAGGGGG